jgi:hypothetical protein
MKEISFDANHLAAVTSMRVETPYPLRHPPNTESAPAKNKAGADVLNANFARAIINSFCE